MLLVKMVTVLLAGLLTLFALDRLMNEVNAAKARVRSRDDRRPRATTKLRQDPRTGIYYPEE